MKHNFFYDFKSSNTGHFRRLFLILIIRLEARDFRGSLNVSVVCVESCTWNVLRNCLKTRYFQWGSFSFSGAAVVVVESADGDNICTDVTTTWERAGAGANSQKIFRNGTGFIAGKFYETFRESAERYAKERCINLVSRGRTNAKIVLAFN